MPVVVARTFAAKALSPDAEAAILEELSAGLRPTVRRAFLDAVERIKDSIDWPAVRRLLAAGDQSGAVTLVSDALSAGGYQGVVAAAARDGVATAGASLAARALTVIPGAIDVRFDVTNPQTSTWMRDYSMTLIRELDESTRASVRQAVTAGVTAGRNPLNVARDVRASIGLTARQTQAVSNFRRMLEELDGEALSRRLRDRRFDRSLARAIADGKPLKQAQIDRMVERYRDRYLRHRSETIARTESIRAVQGAQQQLWRQLVADGTVLETDILRKWVYTHDGRARAWHASIPWRNPDGVGLEQPFITDLGPLMFPGDPAAPPANTINCRCTVVVRYAPNADRR